MALDNAGEPGTISKNEHGDTLFSVGIKTDQGMTEKVGIILKGTASQ
jgi:hypothetical protein